MRRLCLAGIAALALLLSASPARAETRTLAVVLGVNTSVDPGVATLKYADDDAAKYVRLFDRLAGETTLLTVFDAESRLVYDDLARRARIPDKHQLKRAIADLRAKVRAVHEAGEQAEVYFVYIGHGARERDGEGYVNLVGEKLTRTELHRLVLSPPEDPLERPDAMHVIIDACSAYFVVHDRGAGLTPAEEDYSGRMGELFGAASATESYPHVGFVLATSGDVKVHEWSAYRGGVFSHLVRSGLSGAADIDLDGRVTYPELGAFIAAASGAVKDPRARLEVTVTPPPARAEAALSDRNDFRPRQLVMLDARFEGHYEVESEDGERLLDLHKPKGIPSVFAVWGSGRYYLSGREGESLLDFSKKTLIAANTASFGERRRASRGAIDEEYRRALFSRPFDYSFYRAYCSLLRLPVPPNPGKPVLPEELGDEALAALYAHPDELRPSTGVQSRTWVALASGLVLGAGSAGMFLLANEAANSRATDPRAQSRAAVYSAAGAGAAVGAGASILLGAALLTLDLSRPPPVLLGISPQGVGVAGTF
ncbi:MAG: hypothetical protein ACOX6T_13075 [Myxococcales bacterium]|jgi:hypothetical protein